VAGVVGPSGGQLTVADEGGRTHDDISATLTIPGRALQAPENITMAVGYVDGGAFVAGDPGTLSALHVAFGPADLDFEKDAHLVVRVGKNRVDVDVKSGQVRVEHESSDSVTYAEAKVKKSRSRAVTLIVKVPGFSVYSLGGGRL
jgi:hypothetical protein